MEELEKCEMWLKLILDRIDDINNTLKKSLGENKDEKY